MGMGGCGPPGPNGITAVTDEKLEFKSILFINNPGYLCTYFTYYYLLTLLSNFHSIAIHILKVIKFIKGRSNKGERLSQIWAPEFDSLD